MKNNIKDENKEWIGDNIFLNNHWDGQLIKTNEINKTLTFIILNKTINKIFKLNRHYVE